VHARSGWLGRSGLVASQEIIRFGASDRQHENAAQEAADLTGTAFRLVCIITSDYGYEHLTARSYVKV
jgi:hypothetical protein